MCLCTRATSSDAVVPARHPGLIRHHGDREAGPLNSAIASAAPSMKFDAVDEPTYPWSTMMVPSRSSRIAWPGTTGVQCRPGLRAGFPAARSAEPRYVRAGVESLIGTPPTIVTTSRHLLPLTLLPRLSRLHSLRSICGAVVIHADMSSCAQPVAAGRLLRRHGKKIMKAARVDWRRVRSASGWRRRRGRGVGVGVGVDWPATGVTSMSIQRFSPLSAASKVSGYAHAPF